MKQQVPKLPPFTTWIKMSKAEKKGFTLNVPDVVLAPEIKEELNDMLDNIEDLSALDIEKRLNKFRK